jgi:hypothetical protein
MLAEISAAIAAVQSVNAAIQTLKEAKGNGSDLSGVIGRWATATEKAQDAEKKGAGKMSYQEALKMESITRQLKNFDRQLQDICLMQGQGDLYASIKRRMEESRLAHEKEVAKIRMQRRQFRENMKLIGIIFGWGATCLGVLMSALYFYTNF